MICMRLEFTEALAKARKTRQLDCRGVVTLLRAQGEETAALFRAADEVRAQFLGKEVHLRGIIEFSNYCRQNCHYCGLRRDNRRLPRYRLSSAEILAAAQKAVEMGLPTIVLQAGEDPGFPASLVAEIIRRLKEDLGVAAVTLSLGEHSWRDYERWRKAGADRYLLKHETADPVLFARLRPGTALRRRLQRLQWLRELGYQIGSGNIVGLPGQDEEILAADVLLLKELAVEMAGIGPFVPHPQTPLAGAPPGEAALTLKVLAVTRLLLPRAHLPATTALAAAHPQGRRLGLCSGANVIMPDVTPAPYRYCYEIYPGKARPGEEVETILSSLRSLIVSLNREVGRGPGHAPEYREAVFGRSLGR